MFLGVETLAPFKYYLVDGPANVTAYNITDEQIEETIRSYVDGEVNPQNISILNIMCHDGGRFLALVSQNGVGYGIALVFSYYLNNSVKLYKYSIGSWTVTSIT